MVFLLLTKLIELFTDEGDVVIDPCAGSGTSIIAAANLGRKAYGFEIKKNFYQDACNLIKSQYSPELFVDMNKIKGKWEEKELF